MRLKRRKQKHSRARFVVLLTVTLLVSLGLLTTSAACSRVTLHPIEQSDIVMLGKGESFNAPKQGAFLSDEYIEQVMKARIKQ